MESIAMVALPTSLSLTLASFFIARAIRFTVTPMEDMMEDTAFKKAILRHLTTIESELMYITLNQIKYSNDNKSPEVTSYLREQYEELSKIASDLKENND